MQRSGPWRLILAILALLTLPVASLRHAVHAGPLPCAVMDDDAGADHAPGDQHGRPDCCVLGGCVTTAALPVLAPHPATRPAARAGADERPEVREGIAPGPPLHPPRAAA